MTSSLRAASGGVNPIQVQARRGAANARLRARAGAVYTLCAMTYPGRNDGLPRFRKARMTRAGSGLWSLLQGKDTSGNLALAQLWLAWSEVLPPEVAGMARPLGHRDRVLLLAAEDPVVVQEAQFLGPLILEKVHAFLGHEVFDKVRFELINGRVPLDGRQGGSGTAASPPVEIPNEYGGLDDLLEEDSAIGRAYRAYVNRMAGEDKSAPRPQENTDE